MFVQRAVDCKNVCFDETVLFTKPKESTNFIFLSAGQLEMSLRENDQMLVTFASLRVDNDVRSSDMPLVCEVLDVFPEYICDFPLKRGVKFSIDLAPCTSPVSMEPY